MGYGGAVGFDVVQDGHHPGFYERFIPGCALAILHVRLDLHR